PPAMLTAHESTRGARGSRRSTTSGCASAPWTAPGWKPPPTTARHANSRKEANNRRETASRPPQTNPRVHPTPPSANAPRRSRLHRHPHLRRLRPQKPLQRPRHGTRGHGSRVRRQPRPLLHGAGHHPPPQPAGPLVGQRGMQRNQHNRPTSNPRANQPPDLLGTLHHRHRRRRRATKGGGGNTPILERNVPPRRHTMGRY